MKQRFLIVCALSMFGVPVMADNFYIFGDVGQGKMTVDGNKSSTLSKTSTSFSLGAGYDFNQFVAIEIAYRELANVTDRGEALDGVDSYFFVDEYTTTALQASIVGTLPINDSFNVFGRVGLANIDTKYTTSLSYEDGNNPPSGKNSESKNLALLGVGAGFDVTRQLAMRVEYNQYAKWDNLKLSSLTIGAVYKF